MEPLLQQLFASGHVIDLVLAVLLLETLLVRGVARQRSALTLPTVAAGVGLLLAWRAAHVGTHWIWIAVPLTAAGLAHGWELWRRWPRP